MLGVATDASPDAIRSAYRRAARQVHPDRVASGSDAMAAVNEAYRVLGDPGRRALYDRTLTTPVATSARPAPTVTSEPGDPSADRPTFLSPDGPARIPWKLMAVLAVLGTAAVLVSASRDGSDGSEPPDGIIRPGSCVVLEPNSDAREVACGTGSGDDLVVDVLVPLDATCPAGTMGHRDRLGLGIACVAA